MSGGYAKKLEKLGIVTIGDLLRHYPRRHEDFAQVTDVCFLRADAKQTVRVRVERVTTRAGKDPRRRVVDAWLGDDTGRMKATWFNNPWVATRLEEGEQYVLSGSVRRQKAGGGLVMMNPAFELREGGLHTGRLVPLYPETKGLTSRWIRTRMADALPTADLMRDEVPQAVADRQRLPPFPQALRGIHFPGTEEQATAARRRIAFRQLLINQLGVLLSREERMQHEAAVIPYEVDVARAIRDALPFTLTDGQRKAAHAIFTDMGSSRPMARLLQGDVGSGKTAVAAMAAAMAARAGRQTLFMAPTEILAQQHARTLEPVLTKLGVRMALLVGSTPAAARRGLLAQLTSGDVDVVVGTHALIEETVQPRALGLVINDEQHRFGVGQRQALANRGAYPHVLSMTATPIPRTLQLTLYGDLTVSVIDEMPPGRTPVKTQLVLPGQREAAYTLVRAEVDRGRQVFVICPLVEDSEVLQARSATGEYDRLRTEVFPDLRLALLHGRMKAADKDAVMEAFKAGRYDILVSTSVVEVGVDVPNATVMMIEGAERFGLAQLHQLRGRVGRAQHQSHCLLLSDTDSPADNARLGAMERYASGFDLAEADLKIRGPGDVLGASGMQHGHDDGLMVAGLLDVRLIAAARDEAELLVAEGIDGYPELARRVAVVDSSGVLS